MCATSSGEYLLVFLLCRPDTGNNNAQDFVKMIENFTSLVNWNRVSYSILDDRQPRSASKSILISSETQADQMVECQVCLVEFQYPFLPIIFLKLYERRWNTPQGIYKISNI